MLIETLRRRHSKAVFFNLFEVAEPKMTSQNFAEPKLPSKKLRGTQIMQNPIFYKLINSK